MKQKSSCKRKEDELIEHKFFHFTIVSCIFYILKQRQNGVLSQNIKNNMKKNQYNCAY